MNLERFSLKGKSGIVTGGGSGIGKAIATGLVQAGAELFEGQTGTLVQREIMFDRG